MMTVEKFIRLILLSIFGGLCAGGLVFIVFLSIEPPKSHEDYLIHLKTASWAAGATSISIVISWIFMFSRKPATTARAIKYGSLTGIVALFIFMSTITFDNMFPLEREIEISTMIIMPFIMFFFGFFFGGFLAPLFGALLGCLSVLGLEEK